MSKERKFTEEECVANGGHFWNYYSANTEVDENFKPTGMSYCMYFHNGEPRYRGCPLCGRVEYEVHEWRKEDKSNLKEWIEGFKK